MTEPCFCPLYEPDILSRFDVAASNIGGKAHSLLLLTQAGVSVPPACVVPIPVCAAGFINGKISETLLCSLQAAVADLEQVTGCGFEAISSPLRIAARSGAAVSMPGTMESVLNVSEWPELLRAVTAVLGSWMSPAAQAFRQARNLTHLPGSALVLQQMVETEAAGVLFTQDPTGGRPGMLCIEAISGLGDRLVSGVETGQCWFISRDSDDVACKPLQDDVPPLLNTLEMLRLKQSALKIESLFQQPVDVEWGRANGDFVFFQARPIVISTAALMTENSGATEMSDPDCGPSRAANHSACEDLKALIDQENIRLNGFRAAGDLFWVRHNLCETLPHPTPLTWSIIQQFMAGSGGFGRLYRGLGFSPSRSIRRKGFLELIGGQIYASPVRLPDLFCVDFPFSFDREELERDPAALDRAPPRLDLERVGPWFLLRSPWILWILWHQRRIRRLRRTIERSFHETLPRYHAFLDEEQRRPIDRLTIPELKAVLQRRMQRVLQEFAPQLMLPGLVGAAAFETGRRKLAQFVSPLKTGEFCQTLLQQLHVPCLADFQSALAELDKRTLSLPEFLAQYGHRADQEMELAEPRWSETPDAALRRAKFSATASLHTIRKQDLAALIKSEIPDLGCHRSCPAVCGLFADALRLLPYRELGKHEFLQGYALLRSVTESLGRATELGNNVYFLTLDELDRWERPETKALISERQRERALWRHFSCPALLDEHGLSLADRPVKDQKFVLQGTIISSGNAAGSAWLPRLEPQNNPVTDAVLIAPSLLPQYVTLFSALRAIIVDQSALLSHGAILARQFGIPVICHPQATQLIREGDRVTMEGLTGSVTVERSSVA